MSSAQAFAKINLALVVGPLRDDGKHEVVTVLQRISLADTVALSVGKQLSVSGFADDTIVSEALQVTTLRVITALTCSSSTACPRSASTRTMSRSDRMPSIRPLLIASTAPIFFSARILIAAESLASGSTDVCLWPSTKLRSETVDVCLSR